MREGRLIHDDSAMVEASTPEQPSTPRSATADGSWMAWSAAGISGIWIAVVLISILAPDMVTGSEQEHMPIAAATSWLWGLMATIAFLWAMSRLRGRAERRPIWIGLTLVTLVLWLVATILGTTLPVVETGTDPTRLPIGAMVAPLAAAVLTVLAGITAGVFAGAPELR
jgi:hypothetical protein